jgi:excinuclease ABC subunit C
MPSPLTDKIAALPTEPGVYLFRDRRRRVLYVGKAVNLRARVRQYTSGHDERTMVPHLVAAAVDVEVVVTSTEKEALLLENTLIKQHRPRYNIKLRDDSNFLHLRIDPRSSWPHFTTTRKFGTDKARYFGPFASATRARRTLAFLQRHFALRTCTDQVLKSRTRPCILHQMGRCCAPCVDLVTPEEYSDIVDHATMFLEGKKRPLVTRLRAQMTAAADALEFEQAAKLRDTIGALEHALEAQNVVDPRLRDRDVWGLHRDGSRGALAVVPVREGAMGEPRAVTFDGELAGDAEIVSSALNAAYPEGAEVPPEILVPVLPPDVIALQDVLTERHGRKVAISAPMRGHKVRLIELAVENARLRYQAKYDEAARARHALQALAELLDLPAPPRRIDCFDNSNLQGEHPVAAMAVLIDGQRSREHYRRYKIKTVVGADDYASMREILTRRVRRGLDEGDLPDLLVVDGGKGQVAVALAALRDLGVHDLPLVGISKPRTEHARGDRRATDKIVLPHIKEPLRPHADHPGLRLLQLVRDEVHNHAVRYHRKVRGKEALVSALEAIPGVGPSRRRTLLRTLGSAKAVLDASHAELAAVPGIGPALATRIREAIDGPPA